MRDSLINKINLTPDVDTVETYYKLLKAYIANDTSYLRTFLSHIESNINAIPPLAFVDGCFHQPDLKSLNVDEAYRFIYSAAFCPYEINVTVSRDNDNSKMHFVIYQFVQDSVICVNEYDKPLTSKNWKEIVQSLNEADFWGLRKNNGRTGLDGDQITVVGYKKGDPVTYTRYNYVYRWFMSPERLTEPLNIVLKISGNKQGCRVLISK